MELNKYQEKAMNTCMPSCKNFSYMMLNLVGEVGEFASKVAKAIRKKQCFIGDMEYHHGEIIGTNQIDFSPLMMDDPDKVDELADELKKEAGDILWQLSGLCIVMGWTLEDVARLNLEKLAERKRNGTIDGNGDGVTKEERS